MPTIVLGFFALDSITPFLQDIGVIGPQPDLQRPLGRHGGGAAHHPLISSLSEDALRAVPSAMREGAYGVGATKRVVSTRIVLPAALSGVMAAIVLAVSRAVGETMAVTLAAGTQPNLTTNLTDPMQTITAYIVAISKGEATRGTPQYESIFAVGMLLFVVTLIINLVAVRLRAPLPDRLPVGAAMAIDISDAPVERAEPLPLRKKRPRPADAIFHVARARAPCSSLLGALAWLLGSILIAGWAALSWDFITDPVSTSASRAGFASALARFAGADDDRDRGRDPDRLRARRCTSRSSPRPAGASSTGQRARAPAPPARAGGLGGDRAAAHCCAPRRRAAELHLGARRAAAQPGRRGQHLEPGRGAVDHLRAARPRPLRHLRRPAEVAARGRAHAGRCWCCRSSSSPAARPCGPCRCRSSRARWRWARRAGRRSRGRPSRPPSRACSRARSSPSRARSARRPR